MAGMSLLLILQLTAGPPVPLDRASVLVGLVGLTADGVTTYRFLHDGSGCEESNPFLGPSPSTPRIVFSAMLSASTMIGVQKLLAHFGHPWPSRIVGYAVGGMGAYAAWHNEHVVCRRLVIQ